MMEGLLEKALTGGNISGQYGSYSSEQSERTTISIPYASLDSLLAVTKTMKFT